MLTFEKIVHLKHLFFALICLVLISCGEAKKERKSYELSAEAQIWYDSTKAIIKAQANLVADSTVINSRKDTTWKNVYHFSSGRRFRYESFKSGLLRAKFEFSKDDKFELRQEICDNGNLVFEGIFYKDEPFGPSVWYKPCEKDLSQQGIRFKDKKIGIWIYQEDGKVTYKDQGNLHLIDSLPTISN